MKLTKEVVEEKELIDKNGHCIIPEGYTEIEPNAFYNCTNLVSIELPSSLREVKKFAFRNCTNLVSIKLLNNLENIGICAFWNCTNLELIELPNSLEVIEFGTFEDCTSLKSVNIPSGLIYIGYSVFWKCTSLPKLGVGKEILEIALKDNYFKQHRGLCSCFGEIISDLMLKYKKPINVNVELPMFTVENAIKYANGRNKNIYWFKNNSDRKKFLEWMLSEVEENSINNEILNINS